MMSIQSLFYPEAVVVVGSTAEGKLGYELIRQILTGGYRQLYAVNPKGQGAFSVPGYDSVSAIGRPVDLAVIASPAQTVPEVLEDCGRAGVKAAVIISAGFSEVGNVAGEQEIARLARRYGIRVVGPNCAGIVNTGNHLIASLEPIPPAGETAFISQSGALGGAILSWAEEQGLGFSKFVSYGNRADLDERELLPYLARDPETRVVALYIESVANGREFMRAVQECARHKPVVVIKAGKSLAGQRATLSHTGSMAGSDAVYEAALRQCGAIRVNTVEEMFDLCKGFACLPPVKGKRIAIVTNSGGPGVLVADRAEEVGLDVAEPSSELQARLASFLPAHCALKNPFDLTVEGTEERYRDTLLAVLQEYDAALALNVSPPFLDSVALARGVCAAAQKTDKPIAVNFMAGRIVAESVAYLRDRGIPNYPIGERAVKVLAQMADYEAHRVSRRSLPEVPGEQRPLPGNGQMLEPEAMAWLRENGIPVPDFRFATAGTEVVQGCHEIGYPVVMKVVSPGILHKSDCGGVILDIRDDETALNAFEAIRRAATGYDFRGVVIYPLIRGAQEVLLGLSLDPQYGPVVAFGLGGIYTEVWRDISLRVAPVDHVEAEALIREIKSIRLLQGIRGQKPCDLDALADLLVNFSRLPFRYPEIGEIDLNPVFLFSDGLVVGDVRVIRKEKAIVNALH
jgi:acetyl coenzyme A synthetase (ADP forming)-like protein